MTIAARFYFGPVDGMNSLHSGTSLAVAQRRWFRGKVRLIEASSPPTWPSKGAIPMSTAESSTFVASDGGGYELQMGRWSRLLCEPFLDFVGAGNVGDVLDVGCGTGSLAGAMLERGSFHRLLGIDFSPVYVAHAARRFEDARVMFKVGDACALDLPDRTFDRVLSLLVLHFIPRTAEAIAEMKRVARPGAVVAAAVWDARGGFVGNRMFFDTAAALDPKAGERRARNYTRPMTRPGELAAAWRTAGFEQVEDTTLGIRMEFASFDDYWAPYEGNDGPGAEYVATLSETGRAQLRNAVRLAYVDGDADGPRSYAALAWAVKGVVPLEANGSPREPDGSLERPSQRGQLGAGSSNRPAP